MSGADYYEEGATPKVKVPAEYYQIGDVVYPYRTAKRKKSIWQKGFGHGKGYEIIGFDTLGNERVLIVKTGKGIGDYEVVYPDEVMTRKVIKKQFSIEAYTQSNKAPRPQEMEGMITADMLHFADEIRYSVLLGQNIPQEWIDWSHYVQKRYSQYGRNRRR